MNQRLVFPAVVGVVALAAATLGAEQPAELPLGQFWKETLKPVIEDAQKFAKESDKQRFERSGHLGAASRMIDVVRAGYGDDPYGLFTPGDKHYVPDASPAGMPQLPSRCLGSMQCKKCFESAHAELEKRRYNLEELRVVNLYTQDFSKKAISFGDSTSGGLHPIVGLEWQAQKRKIEQSLKEFEAKYDSKYVQLMGKLRGALDQIASCEGQYFDDPDWFQRYGFMYYQFMEARYRR